MSHVELKPREFRRNSVDDAAARERCRAYRKRILDISQQVTALHVAPAFSCIEITDVIYNTLMRRDAGGEYRDVFLMSKGHGCMVQYVILEEQGCSHGAISMAIANPMVVLARIQIMKPRASRPRPDRWDMAWAWPPAKPTPKS